MIIRNRQITDNRHTDNSTLAVEKREERREKREERREKREQRREKREERREKREERRDKREERREKREERRLWHSHDPVINLECGHLKKRILVGLLVKEVHTRQQSTHQCHWPG
jgi:hypothetical protein